LCAGVFSSLIRNPGNLFATISFNLSRSHLISFS
jgi:hypothetical protein